MRQVSQQIKVILCLLNFPGQMLKTSSMHTTQVGKKQLGTNLIYGISLVLVSIPWLRDIFFQIQIKDFFSIEGWKYCFYKKHTIIIFNELKKFSQRHLHFLLLCWHLLLHIPAFTDTSILWKESLAQGNFKLYSRKFLNREIFCKNYFPWNKEYHLIEEKTLKLKRKSMDCDS